MFSLIAFFLIIIRFARVYLPEDILRAYRGVTLNPRGTVFDAVARAFRRFLIQTIIRVTQRQVKSAEWLEWL
jgi:hypothetical protein